MKCPFCGYEPEYGGSPFELQSHYDARDELRCEKCREDFSEIKLVVIGTEGGPQNTISMNDLIRYIKSTILR